MTLPREHHRPAADDETDQNAENAPVSIVDQLSRTKTKDEIASKKQRRKESQAGIEQVKTNGTKPAPAPPAPAITQEPPRGRNQAQATTAASAPRDVDTTKLAPKRETIAKPRSSTTR